MITRKQALVKLKEKFNHSDFIDDQWLIIQEALLNKSVLVIKQTGFGKSLCYQLPALFFDGVTLVFSPLIALMRDQVNYLQQIGIPAACINSDNSFDENNRIIGLVLNNKIKLLYVAPERQQSSEWIDLISKINLSMIVIDEAHCISVWGHDFRPAYKKITNTIAKFSVPIMALTATANHKTELDIKDQVGNFKTIRGNLFRENLKLHVIQVNDKRDKYIIIAHLIKSIEGAGIVFTGTKIDAENFSRFFSEVNISNTYYHSKISNRSSVENSVINNKVKCVVSTNAFGMGIDKPDFRFIIHTQFPASPLHYYQEIGRAGRDGKISHIFLLWNRSDIGLHHYFINTAKPPINQYKAVIDYLINSSNKKSFSIATALDMEETSVKSIMNDLDDQKIIYKIVEYKDEPYKYQLNDNIQNIIDVKTELENDILHLVTEPITIYSLSKKILGNTKKINKDKISMIIEELLTEGIIERISTKRSSVFYQLIDDAPDLNEDIIDSVRNYKYNQLYLMEEYLKTSKCRMNFLCINLGDTKKIVCGICDNCSLNYEIKKSCKGNCDNCYECIKKEYVKYNSTEMIQFIYPSEISLQLEERKNKLLNGFACYYDRCVENIGKDEIDIIISLIHNKKFDLIISLPENDINFCNKLSEIIGIPHVKMSIENNNKRVKNTNWYNRKKHAEQFILKDLDITNKSIILFDRECHTGITVKGVGKYLSKLKVKLIQPIFISKM